MRSGVVALAGLFAIGVQAVPRLHDHAGAALHARLHPVRRDEDVHWVTEIETDIVTVVETIYVGGPSRMTVSGMPQKHPHPVVATTSRAPDAAAASVSTSTTTSTMESYLPPPPAVAPQSLSPASSSSSQAPVPTPAAVVVATSSTSDPAPLPTESPGSSASSSASSSSGPDLSFSGDMTWWEPALGACGFTNTGSEAVVALPESLFDQYTPNGNPNDNTLCGKHVTITGVDGGSYQGQIVDRCVGCGMGSLDLSETLFNTVTSNGNGRVHNVHWTIAV